MSYIISNSNFAQIFNKSEDGAEGIVLLGAGGDQKEWVNGVTKMLFDEGIATSSVPEEVWNGFESLVSTGGRHDLVMWFKDDVDSTLNINKMAIWRIRFGDCSWVSDFVVNYASHYGY